MKKYGFGVDVGGTTVKMGFFETSGELLDKWEIKTDTSDNGKAVLPDIAQAIDNKLAQEGISKSDVEGVGIGVPGPVRSDGVVNGCVNLGWGVINVAEELGAQTGLKVKVGNDANVAGLGEMWQGGGKGSKDVIMVTLGTGVGGGIIVDGHVVAGYNGAGGEIGHITVNHDEIEPCNCGQYGCLEQYTSATGIVRMAKRKLAKTQDATKLRDYKDITAKDIFDAAKEGDTFAKERVDDLGQKLALAAGNIALMVDPEVFVIGGGVSRAGQILLDAVNAHFKKYTFGKAQETGFVLATLGNDAGIYGAASLMLS